MEACITAAGVGEEGGGEGGLEYHVHQHRAPCTAICLVVHIIATMSSTLYCIRTTDIRVNLHLYFEMITTVGTVGTCFFRSPLGVVWLANTSCTFKTIKTPLVKVPGSVPNLLWEVDHNNYSLDKLVQVEPQVNQLGH